MRANVGTLKAGALVTAALLANASWASVASAGVIPEPGCTCDSTSVHCYNMRRDVTIFLGIPNHTFTMCEDAYGNRTVFEDNWAVPNYSQDSLGSAWVESDLGCIAIDSLNPAKAAADDYMSGLCPGYNECAGANGSLTCQLSYGPFNPGMTYAGACFCFPWQDVFRARLYDMFVQVCSPAGGYTGGGSENPSDYDGPWFLNEGEREHNLWCYERCEAVSCSRLNGVFVSCGCTNWSLQCALL
jgi:hypothetical protein